MEGLNPAAGGRPGMTKYLNVAYKKYAIGQQEQGLQPLDWPIWLEQNGYKLGPDKLVTPVGNTEVDNLIKINSY